MSDQPGLPAGTELERWVRMRRRLNAPPQRVFRAWSDPEELARWFPEQVEGGLAVGSRSILVWRERRVWWDVVEAHPDRGLVVRWPGLVDERLITTVRVLIEPAGFGSRIDLEDGPFALDQPRILDAWAAATGGWSEALALLRAHLDFSIDLRPRAYEE
ncbi:MAG TPA: SRPBCC domain-containing protein [Candidatus Limnocylindrales bacterium]|nr:SRPBCC domain-containing protein [Candidatus Limnocylindrales bacterium]